MQGISFCIRQSISQQRIADMLEDISLELSLGSIRQTANRDRHFQDPPPKTHHSPKMRDPGNQQDIAWELPLVTHAIQKWTLSITLEWTVDFIIRHQDISSHYLSSFFPVEPRWTSHSHSFSQQTPGPDSSQLFLNQDRNPSRHLHLLHHQSLNCAVTLQTFITISFTVQSDCIFILLSFSRLEKQNFQKVYCILYTFHWHLSFQRESTLHPKNPRWTRLSIRFCPRVEPGFRELE